MSDEGAGGGAAAGGLAKRGRRRGHKPKTGDPARPPKPAPAGREASGPPRGGAAAGRGKPGRGRRRGRPQDKQTPDPAAPTRGRDPKGPSELLPSRIETTAAADVPLAPAEVAEMRGHLRFLFQNRKLLRLKVNAAEDLLLNGAHEPTHRGQCMHLLAKVNLSDLTSALSRIDDPRAKAALVGGVVRFSSDVGVLLLYLETLVEDDARGEAAAAFGVAVRRIEFASLSAAQMRRVLEVIQATFAGNQRVQVLFGLLLSHSFRFAFDAAAESLPPEVHDVFVPLRAVHEVVFDGRPNRFTDADLRRGVNVLLGAPESVLRGYPEAIRERLLESAVRLVDDPGVADRATDALLASLPTKSRGFSRLGVRRAAELLRRHEDDRAGRVLRQIAAAHADFELPGRWLAALEAPRAGRFALVAAADRPAADGPRVVLGFWLDEQRPVLVRTGGKNDAARVASEAAIQREGAMVGVLPVLASGTGKDGRPYVAMPVVGEPMVIEAPDRRGSRDARGGGGGGGGARGRDVRRATLALQLCGIQLLQALARTGVCLPDVEPRRFRVEAGPWPALFLVDFTGVARTDAEQAQAAHRELAATWCSRLAPSLPSQDRDGAIATALDDKPDLGAWIDLLTKLL